MMQLLEKVLVVLMNGMLKDLLITLYASCIVMMEYNLDWRSYSAPTMMEQVVSFCTVRDGSTFKAYIDGIETFPTTGFNIHAGTAALHIGGYGGAAGQDPPVQISNYRIVKGTSVYTSESCKTRYNFRKHHQYKTFMLSK